MSPKLFGRLVALALLIVFSIPAHAAFHLWQITKAYSNADGTVQFIELTAFGTAVMMNYRLTDALHGTPHTDDS